MASASEIKTRINGISDTKKITDAMYMISSAKMRRALRELEKTQPYFKALSEKIGELFYALPQMESRYFKVPVQDAAAHRTHGILLITSDKGLAGAYNQTAIKVCEEYMSRHPQTVLFIIGEYGRQYFINKKIDFVRDFYFSPERPQMLDARRMCTRLLEYYDNERLDEISIIYTDYQGNRPGECKKISLLPLERTRFHCEEVRDALPKKQFLPSPNAVLEGVIPSYLTGFIYSSLVDSFCSEQQARMAAMKSATDNAEDMLRTLKLQYNEIRQAAITNEMIEITAGARALKEKRRKAVTGEMSDGES